jgi:pectin methylesterase-like acyl-CoA thioesterase
MRKPLALVAFLALGGCVSASSLHLPQLGANAAPAHPLTPVAPVCSITLTATIPAEPKLPAGADLPAATTPQMSAAEAVYFQWLHDFATWAHGLQASLSQAQSDCGH